MSMTIFFPAVSSVQPWVKNLIAELVLLASILLNYSIVLYLKCGIKTSETSVVIHPACHNCFKFPLHCQHTCKIARLQRQHHN